MCMSMKAIKALRVLLDEQEQAELMDEAKNIKAAANADMLRNRVIAIKNRLH